MDLLQRAVANNLEWCALMSEGGEELQGVWRSDAAPPPLFPDAVTLRPGASADHVAALVQDRASASVKDSFADVDLAPFGYTELFEAQWIGRSANNDDALTWDVVTTPNGVAEWSAAADLPRPLPDRLRSDRAVRVVARRRAGRIIAGAVLNVSETVVGASNVFGPTGEAVTTWRDLVATATKLFSKLPIVGYEHGAELDAAHTAGFTDLGQLRVWRRT